MTQTAPFRSTAFTTCTRSAALLVLLGLAASPLRAQAPETVGQIEGSDIAVKGSVSLEIVAGKNTTLLASGSDVTVRSGQARLVLVEGGEIAICGPAHFSLLKSGGAITLALDYGRVHSRLESVPPLMVYTPLIAATLIPLAGARDITVGLETTGAMCVLATRGAVRVEQQFTGQGLLVPQGGEILLASGQLESMQSATGSCPCEFLAAQAAPRPKPPQFAVPAREATALPKPAEERAQAQEPPRIPANEEPIYKVFMPPLTFDAASPEPPPDPSPESILLAREVRVRPSVIFRGRVEAAPLPPPEPTPPPAPVASAPQAPPQAKKQASLLARIWNFFKRLGE